MIGSIQGNVREREYKDNCMKVSVCGCADARDYSKKRRNKRGNRMNGEL